ncbi:MAG TPA: outer-membrane lipoprotein carrier protein LolA [Caulobacteraceae bacterium]|jgi:outer membrane lipoprotein-sorting protein|nr:outer-membrane lipoprotein carrier protein LolA [Caulobacteraceae bacterium]HEX4096852.1 outer-membrane lipoprotein carrier protein LolA [Caulobacteraceae bacterium]
MSATTRRAILAVLAAGAAAPRLALADPASNPLVAKAVAYLDTVNNVKARFTQSDTRGDVAQGTVYLSRPGRARFEYDPPSGLLITSDGRTVTLTDTRLKTFQRIPLTSTPLAVFLADHVRLDRGAQITRVDPSADGFSITARDTRNLAGGEITLYFSNSPMRLTGWAIIDAQARTTRVSLGAFSPMGAQPDSFFTQGPA